MRKILPASEIEGTPSRASLLEEHGPLMGGGVLWRSLGYRTGGAFRKAIEIGTAPIPTFTIVDRKGRFAWTKDVVAWLHTLEASTSTASGEKGGADHE